MRVVIPYRLTANDGEELRYAIRSVYKHFKSISGILIVGDKPTWYQGDHIPLADLKGEKERSMQLKVLQAPDENFLYSTDDHFALEDFDYQLPHYYDTTCSDLAERHTQADYRKMYYNCGPGWLNFDIHTPMVMNMDRFRSTFASMDQQTPIKSTYAQGMTGYYLADIKIRGEHTTAEIEYLTKDRPFFSTHDSAINEDMLAFFRKLYQHASPCEK